MATLLLTTMLWCALSVATHGNPLNCTDHEIGKQVHMICEPKSNSQTEISIKRWTPKNHERISKATLQGCYIRRFHQDALWELRDIEYLDLSNNIIDELPMPLLNQASKLKYLDLSHNKLTKLPPNLFVDTPLQYLNLSYNQLDEANLDDLPELKELKYNDNAFSGVEMNNINDVITGVDRIKVLHLSRNRLEGGPDELLCNQKYLDELYLSECSLVTVPSFILRSNLGSVSKIDLSRNQITEIKDEIYKDKKIPENLRHIDFSSNYIKKIHRRSFNNLKTLETVNLSQNELVSIPGGLFEDLASLSNVNLSGNQLTYIDEKAFGGNALQLLDLSNNLISFLPKEFEKCLASTAVVTLILELNPMNCKCRFDFMSELSDPNGVEVVESPTKCFQPPKPSKVCYRDPEVHKTIVELYKEYIRNI